MTRKNNKARRAKKKQEKKVVEKDEIIKNNDGWLSEKDFFSMDYNSCSICNNRIECSCDNETNIKYKHRSCFGRSSYPKSKIKIYDNRHIQVEHICSRQCYNQMNIFSVFNNMGDLTIYDDDIDIYDSDDEFFVGHGSI